ncbi:hypothetical protein DFH11DRAFT_1481780, partial [Phellopilus nigrolimitatus]
KQMHCAFLLPIMKRHGLAHLIDQSLAGMQFRRLLLDTVLATNMGVHMEFMQRFARLMENPQDFDITQARILLCQALIKCADISNPSRPHAVSQHWSAALASEWASQALLERQLCLPVSVQDSDDPITEANGQISFITLFCCPLLEITSLAVPAEMKCFAEQCSTNHRLWHVRLTELKEYAERLEPNYPPVPYRAVSPPQTQDYNSVFPLSLPAHFLPTSRASSINGSDSLVGSEMDSRTGHYRERTMSAASNGIDMTGFSIESSGNGVNGHSHSAIPYAESMSSSSRSASPLPFTNGNAAIPASSSPFQTYRHISTQRINVGIPAFVPPSDPSSPATETTSESVSPRSEYAPHTPASYPSGHMHSGTSIGSSSGAYAPVPESISSIRAAYKLSVRKKKSFHRNSWTPSLSSLAPHPPMPSPLS